MQIDAAGFRVALDVVEKGAGIRVGALLLPAPGQVLTHHKAFVGNCAAGAIASAHDRVPQRERMVDSALTVPGVQMDV